MVKKRIKKPEGQAAQWHTPKKRMRGEGVFYDEPKSETVRLSLTPTGKAGLKQLAGLDKLSMSEYVERWVSSRLKDLNLPST